MRRVGARCAGCGGWRRRGVQNLLVRRRNVRWAIGRRLIAGGLARACVQNGAEDGRYSAALRGKDALGAERALVLVLDSYVID